MSRTFPLLMIACTVARAGEYGDRYAAKVAGLDKSKPESVCEARDALRAWLPKAEMADRATMFRGFLKLRLDTASEGGGALTSSMEPFLNRAMYVITGNDWKWPQSIVPYVQKDSEIWAVIKPWVDCGYGVSEGEGYFYPKADENALLEFGGQLPQDLKALVVFWAQEAGDILGDAALAISWQQLADRLQRWERILQKYPSLDALIHPDIRSMAWILFFGIDNTPMSQIAKVVR